MSEWKNPTWGNRSFENNKEWSSTPMFYDQDEDEETTNDARIGSAVKTLFGFISITAINAAFVFFLSVLIGIDLPYRNAVGVSFIYILWRAYDTVIFRRIRNL